MTLFTRMKHATNNAQLPQIAEADIDPLVIYEPGSYDHWIFNKNGPAGLTGLNAGKVIAPQSDAPSYSADHITIPVVPVGKALMTDYVETANLEDTICMVFKNKETAAAVSALWGTYGNIASAGTKGGMPFLSGASPARKLFLSNTGINNSVDTGMTIPSTTGLYFVGVARSFSGSSKRVSALVGGQAGFSATYSGTYVPQAALPNVGLGASAYVVGGGSVAPLLEIVEFFILPRAVSLPDLASIYQRRKTKLATLGYAVA